LRAEENANATSTEVEKIKVDFAEQETQMKEIKTEIKEKRECYENAKKYTKNCTISQKIYKNPFFCRKLDECLTSIETYRNNFVKLEKEDTKTREDIKHSKSRSKKLQVSIEAEKQKV